MWWAMRCASACPWNFENMPSVLTAAVVLRLITVLSLRYIFQACTPKHELQGFACFSLAVAQVFIVAKYSWCLEVWLKGSGADPEDCARYPNL